MMSAQDQSIISTFAPVLVLVAVVVFITIVIQILGHTIGPKRRGAIKDAAYESGMPLFSDAQRRFNVRFYIVAVLFLLFDIEVVFLWPWAVLYRAAAVADQPVAELGGMVVGAGYLLVGGTLFLLILLLGFIYEWRKGVFRWE